MEQLSWVKITPEIIEGLKDGEIYQFRTGKLFNRVFNESKIQATSYDEILLPSPVMQISDEMIKDEAGGEFQDTDEGMERRAFIKGAKWMRTQLTPQPIVDEDKEAFKRLNEVWGNDEDGQYKSMYESSQPIVSDTSELVTKQRIFDILKVNGYENDSIWELFVEQLYQPIVEGKDKYEYHIQQQVLTEYGAAVIKEIDFIDKVVRVEHFTAKTPVTDFRFSDLTLYSKQK